MVLSNDLVQQRAAPIHVLCALMGHSKMETTKDYYLAVETRDAKTGRDGMSAIFGSTHRTHSGHTRVVPAEYSAVEFA